MHPNFLAAGSIRWFGNAYAHDRYNPASTMKNRILIAVFAAALVGFGGQGMAAENEAVKSEPKAQARADLQVLVMKIQNKLKDGKKTENDLADEMKEFNTLLAKYKDDKT